MKCFPPDSYLIRTPNPSHLPSPQKGCYYTLSLSPLFISPVVCSLESHLIMRRVAELQAQGPPASKFRDRSRRRRRCLVVIGLLVAAVVIAGLFAHRLQRLVAVFTTTVPLTVVKDPYPPGVGASEVARHAAISVYVPVDAGKDVRREQIDALCTQTGGPVIERLTFIASEGDTCRRAKLAVMPVEGLNPNHPGCQKVELLCGPPADLSTRFLDSLVAAPAATLSSKAVSSTTDAPSSQQRGTHFALILAADAIPQGPSFLVSAVTDMVVSTVVAASCTSVFYNALDVPVVLDRGFDVVDGESYLFPSLYLARRFSEMLVKDERAQSIDVVGALSGRCLLADHELLSNFAHDARTKHPLFDEHEVTRRCKEDLGGALTMSFRLISTTDARMWSSVRLEDENAARLWIRGTRFDYEHNTAVDRYSAIFSVSPDVRYMPHPPEMFDELPDSLTNAAAEVKWDKSINVSRRIHRALKICELHEKVDDLTLFGWSVSFYLRASGYRLISSPARALVLTDRLNAAGRQSFESFGSKTNIVSYPIESDWFAPWFKPEFWRHDDTTMSRLVVVWDGYCCKCCGFSTEIMQFIIPLSRRVIVRSQITDDCFCLGYPAFQRDALRRLFISPQSYALLEREKIVVWISHRPPDSYLSNPLFRYRTPDYFIGRSMYEFTRFPAAWVRYTNIVNEVWVPGQWTLDVFAENGVAQSKLFAIPEAVDVYEFNNETTNRMDLPEHLSHLDYRCTQMPKKSAFNFISHFKWEPRKGWHTLLESYYRAFEGRTDVALYILTFLYFPCPGNPHNVTDTMSIVEEFYRRLGAPRERIPPVCVITTNMPEQEMLEFYNAADTFVLPTRGEGWGLPLIQAMALGKPTIGTMWGGQSAFMTKDTSFLLEVDAIEEPSPDGNPYGWDQGKKWATPSKRHLIELMQYVQANKAHADAVGSRARDHVRKRYSEDAVTDVVEGRLKIITDFVALNRR